MTAQDDVFVFEFPSVYEHGKAVSIELFSADGRFLAATSIHRAQHRGIINKTLLGSGAIIARITGPDGSIMERKIVNK